MSNHVVDRHRVTEHPHRNDECCAEIPELRRLQYFYGQMLSGADLQEEQRYFHEKLKLLNRCVHGYGVLCGLRVTPAPAEEPCDPATDRQRESLEREFDDREKAVADIQARLAEAKDEEKPQLEEALKKAEGEREDIQRQLDVLCPPDPRRPPSARVTIECGIAIDCAGNEIIVRRSRTIDLFHHLDPVDVRRAREDWRRPIWVSICFCEAQVEPVRPVYADPCTPAETCRHAKIQDSYRITVSLDRPDRDTRCEPCCCACDDACLVLARIDRIAPGRPIPAGAVHNEVRRRFGLYDWTTVTGISWVHGGLYTSDQAADLLGRYGHRDGLEFRFSRDVLTETLQDGVINVWVVEGGRGRAGDIYNVPGKISYPAGHVTDRVYFRQDSDDKFHDGDRILIRLGGDFVLDECCHPLDGNHIGGRVPLLPGSHGIDHLDPQHTECTTPPSGYGPWTSGNRAGGGTFESWFTIRERDYRPEPPEHDPDYKREPRPGYRGAQRPDEGRDQRQDKGDQR